MRRVIIMRGIPYSGKSRKAREIAGSHGCVHSANDYHMVDGVYRYDNRRVYEFHRRNNADFVNSLVDDISIVILDNCNLRVEDFSWAIDEAVKYGYAVEIVTMHNHPATLAFKAENWRGIPRSKFLAMKDQFEPLDLEAYLATPVPAD